MAHNGGPPPPRVPPRPPPALLPRVHRARAPSMSAPAPLTAPLTPLSRRRPPPLPSTSSTPAFIAGQQQQQQAQVVVSAAAAAASPVTLTSPRPDGQRAVNEYVETPFRPAVAPHQQPVIVSAPPQSSHHHGQLHRAGSANEHRTLVSPAQRNKTVSTTSPSSPAVIVETGIRPATLPLSNSATTTATGIVTKQPIAFTKGGRTAIGGGASGGGSGAIGAECTARGSIICPECGRCRCESCQQPRPLPERWVCNNEILCSADTLIDYASCLCCVKGLFYHCGGDSDGDDSAQCTDEPCGCSPHRRVARWGCLVALTAVLPCLLCYWPLRGCARSVEALYARHTRSGCRCAPRPHQRAQDQLTPEKRLLELDSSPDF